MAKGSTLALSVYRKRALVNEDAGDEIHQKKKRHIQPETTDRDDSDMSLDSDIEALFSEADDDEDAEDVDNEPEQGEVYWSEDQEEYPPCAIYHADVKEHQASITGFAIKVTDQLSEVCHEGDDIARLHAEADACQRFPELKKMVVALVGNAGSGKSSLINSILDIPHVARGGNYGSACTCAITEYMSAFPGQNEKFAAKVEFLNPKQRCKLLKDHLREYAYYYFEETSDWTPEERKEHRDQAQTAEATFLDLFRGKPSFNNREELKSYIRTAHENETGMEVSAQMDMWCDELIAAHASASLLVIETDQAFRLRRALSPFLSSSNVSSREPRLWPLVFKVIVGIRGPRVLENLIFADMPGLSDISRVRVKASINYIRSSDYLWIVVSVLRCVSDTGVDSILYEFGDRFKGRLAMICTKIDDSMRSGSFKDQYPHAVRRLDKIDKCLREAQNNGSRPDEENFANLRLKFMIQTRSHEIAKEIYEKKSEYFSKGGDDPVFFVSNEHYMWLQGYRESGTEQILLQLDAAMTGIPALRRYALSIPSRDLWLTFMTHIEYTSIACMKSIAIWAARTNADHGAKLRKIKQQSAKDIDRSISGYVNAIHIDAVQSLAVTMRSNVDKVAQKGYDYLHNTARKLQYNTIQAVVRREGTFNSGSKGLIQWNEKLKQPTTGYLSSKWVQLFSKETNHILTAEKKIKGDLDTLRCRLEKMMDLYEIPVEEFGDLINAQKHGITRAFQMYTDDMDKELKNAKQLTENDMKFGFFAKMMRPTYTEAAEVKGTGCKNIVMTMFETLINKRTKESPFIKMGDFAANKVGHHATVLTVNLHEQCTAIYDEVFNQFGDILEEAEDRNGEVKAVKTALHDYLSSIDTKMDRIVEKLKAIERNPRIKTEPNTTRSGSVKVKKEEKQPSKGLKIKLKGAVVKREGR